MNKIKGIYYLTMRLWIGLWAAFFCLIIVAVDGSAIVRYFTRWAFQPDFQLDLIIKNDGFVSDSQKKPLPHWLASSSSRSHCQSCSVSFMKHATWSHCIFFRNGQDLQSAHGLWPWRDHNGGALWLWSPQRHCSGSAQSDVPVSTTIQKEILQ